MAATTANMAQTMVLPAAVRYLSDLIDTAARGNDLGLTFGGTLETAREVSGLVDDLKATLGKLAKARASAHQAKDEAVAMKNKTIRAMADVRTTCDALERLVPADLWPMPTYREMLFIK